MSCCAPGAEFDPQGSTLPSPDEMRLASRKLGDGTLQVELSVPAAHCGACIQAVEQALSRLDGVVSARVNLSTRRVSVRFADSPVPPIVETLSRLGYPPHLFEETGQERDGTLGELIRAVAISGFAAGNIMLLSVSVWSGAEGSTRDLFHWVSALIALPALVFAGRVYYRSAWSALRHGRMNMDVPIAIGVSLAYGMSLYETITHGHHAYFDAAVSLLFFLLIGRTLDHVMRDKARAAVLGLAKLAPRGAIALCADGSHEYRQVSEIEPGMRLLITAGERVPVDARVERGTSDLDCSLVTGESNPQAVAPGAMVRAGTLNLTGALTIEATARAADSFLAEMMRMMEAAEGGRAKYRRIADRVSALYAPVVHLTAFATFLGWMAVDGDWHRAIIVAIAVLIITCPCALGLAVPIVQVVAARRLFERGVMVRDGSAMERLAEVDAIVFDKTGTLTAGRPRLIKWYIVSQSPQPATAHGGPGRSGKVETANLPPCGGEAASAKLPISPLVGEMSGRTEGGATERCRRGPSPPAKSTLALNALAMSTQGSVLCVAPLCPAGHLPHKGGDWQLDACHPLRDICAKPPQGGRLAVAALEPLAPLEIAAALAAHSRHPLSQAIARHAGPSSEQVAFDGVVEHPGYGIEGTADGITWRLGRAGWAHGRQGSVAAHGPPTVLTRNGNEVATFLFEDMPREGAARAIAQFRQDGISIEMLSGDSEAACRDVASALGIVSYSAGLLPAEKVARIAEMAQAGRRVLMVGDGLNDAPALGAAHVSMAPASAADVGRNAADFVFLRQSLEAVPLAIGVSRRARRLIRQNIALAIVYNAIAVPIAILGHVTPLIAAIAMSASSVLVIANALRLQGAAARPKVSDAAGGVGDPAPSGAL